MISQTPTPPYYAVIFTSVPTEGDNGFAEMTDRMVESVRNEIGITVSYWRYLESIRSWKEHAEHSVAQERRSQRVVQILQNTNCQGGTGLWICYLK